MRTYRLPTSRSSSSTPRAVASAAVRSPCWATSRELDVDVGVVNPREDPSPIERFDVRSVPLFVLFRDGTAVARLADGFVPGDALAAWIEENTN